MGIEFIENNEFANAQPSIESASDDFKNKILVQQGSKSFGYPFSLSWSLYIKEERIDLEFTTAVRHRTDASILTLETPSASFGDHSLYDSININVRASFDDRKLLLNGTRSVRRDSGAGWFTSRFDNVVLMTW
jgi:hypothetical protein